MPITKRPITKKLRFLGRDQAANRSLKASPRRRMLMKRRPGSVRRLRLRSSPAPYRLTVQYDMKANPFKAIYDV
jgi:hypothetical protein